MSKTLYRPNSFQRSDSQRTRKDGENEKQEQPICRFNWNDEANTPPIESTIIYR